MAWSPERQSRLDWHGWAGDTTTPDDDVNIDETHQTLRELPLHLRRRSGPFGRHVLSAALACRGGAGARYVFCSRHGDLARTTTLLSSLAANETPSPAEFSHSVHHALAGLLSIHTANRQGHIAIAAGNDSFGFGFMEAAVSALDEKDRPVLLVYADELPPPDYAPLALESAEALPLIVAVVLEPGGGDGANRFAARQVSALPFGDPAIEQPLPLAFLRFLLGPGDDSVVATGDRMQFHWSRDARPC